MSRVVLCVDGESARHPELVGLDGVRWEDLSWLELHTDAERARRAAREDDVGEIWVAASDDMPAVNVAAGVKKDNPAKTVFLISFEPSGSLLSRARAAGVNGVLSRKGFSRRFSFARARCSAQKADAAAARAAVDAAVAEGPACDMRPALGRPAPEKTRREQRRPSSRKAFVLTVVSGSGGVGKSATAVAAAHLAQGRGLRTAVLDCDFQFGDMKDIAGAAHVLAVDEVLSDPSQIDDDFCEGLSVVGSSLHPERAEDIGRFVPRLLDILADRFDVVVVNTGSFWTEAHVLLVERSSCALFLVDQRTSSIRACRRAVDLCLRCGIAASVFAYAVNRCSRKSFFTSVDVSCALEGAHVFELKDGGDAVEELLVTGGAGDLASSRNDFFTSVEAMLDVLLAVRGREFASVQETDGPGKKKSFFRGDRRLRKRKARSRVDGGPPRREGRGYGERDGAARGLSHGACR